jgi:hypothetical protein
MEIETVGILREIWQEKNWAFPTINESESAFDKLCEMTSLLNSEERQLLVNLTRFYTLYSFTDYQHLLIDALSKISAAVLTGADQIVVAPLIGPEDVAKNRSKSGHCLPYVAQYVAIPANASLAHLPITALAAPIFDRSKLSGTKLLVILLDDFVGSGDTAIKAVAEVRHSAATQDEIVVVSLVTMQKGIDALAHAAIPFFWAKLAEMGIDDNPHIKDKAEAYQLVDSIWEAHLKLAEKYKRGYKNSEALVTLVRTPNNTLPMYWCKASRDGSEWPSPFPR